MSARDDFDEELEHQVTERIELMEQPGYQFPAQLTRGDWRAIVIIPIVSLCLLVIGAFL